MITLFRKIRQRLLSEGNTGKYLKYAIGEIMLVVVGILIAVQVNNWNIERVDKQREHKYLSNIVIDLEKDLTRLNYLIKFRKDRLIGDRKIIDHANGMPINDLNELTINVVNSLMEENFRANNNTYSELSSSGNLNLISNDSIKVLLLELEELFKTNDLNIDHETYDYREYISKPLVQLTNMDQLFPVYTGEKTVLEQQINNENFKALLSSSEYKNGLYIMTTMSEFYISMYQDMQAKSKRILAMIDRELNQ